MPIHDWTRVRSNQFHDFHQSWTIAIRNALNAGLLPAGTVIRCVARTQEQLRRAGVRAELAVVAEASARHRLSRLVPAHGSAG